MRKLVFIVCVLFSLGAFAAEGDSRRKPLAAEPESALSAEPAVPTQQIRAELEPAVPNEQFPANLSGLEQYAKKTADNTEPQGILDKTIFDDWLILLVAIFSAIFAPYAYLSYRFSKRTAENVEEQTRKQAINMEAQKKIFEDLIRHLYRNKVCVCAMRWKLETEGFDCFYPSEEHLLKLKVLPEDMRLDRFDNTPDFYGELHKVELLFRNYNIEVDVALMHLKMRHLPVKDKIRDLVFTLEFKSQYLTHEIQALAGLLEMPITDEAIAAMLAGVSKKYEETNIAPHLPDTVPSREMTESGRDRYRYYDDVLGLSTLLDSAISHEYNKINLIEFV